MGGCGVREREALSAHLWACKCIQYVKIRLWFVADFFSLFFTKQTDAQSTWQQWTMGSRDLWETFRSDEVGIPTGSIYLFQTAANGGLSSPTCFIVYWLMYMHVHLPTVMSQTLAHRPDTSGWLETAHMHVDISSALPWVLVLLMFRIYFYLTFKKNNQLKSWRSSCNWAFLFQNFPWTWAYLYHASAISTKL